MGWHWANLEYGCAAPLSRISMAHWNQDEAYGGFGGAHAMVEGGYGRVTDALAEDLGVRLGAIVRSVRRIDGEGDAGGRRGGSRRRRNRRGRGVRRDRATGLPEARGHSLRPASECGETSRDRPARVRDAEQDRAGVSRAVLARRRRLLRVRAGPRRRDARRPRPRVHVLEPRTRRSQARPRRPRRGGRRPRGRSRRRTRRSGRRASRRFASPRSETPASTAAAGPTIQ